MNLQDKIEEAMNDMTATGKMPGLCCLNKHTLGELAKEWKLKERITATSSMPDNSKMEDSKIICGTPQNAGIVYFDVDENLVDGEIVIKDVMDPEYDRVAKEKGT
jgi:hypothetical protein